MLSLVQHGTNGPTFVASGATGQVLPANCLPGNSVVVIIFTNGSSLNLVTGVSSSIGTFTKACDLDSASSVWVCDVATGAADTITVTTQGGTYTWVAVGMEWSGGVTGANPISGGTGGGSQFTVNFSNGVGQTVIGYDWFPVITSDPGSPWTNFTAWTNGPHITYQASASAANTSAQWNESGTGSGDWGGITLLGNSGSGFFDFD